MSAIETARSAGWFVFYMLVVICVSSYYQIKQEKKDALSQSKARN